MVQSTFEYVGIGIRFVAQLVDVFIVSLIASFVLSLAGYDVTASTGLGFSPILLAMLVMFFLYFTLMEGFLGTTVGKMIFKVKVLSEDGNPCGPGRAAVRNLLRFIDALPFLYLIAFILIARSERKQRLGDRVAKTVVVRIRRNYLRYPPPPVNYPPPPQPPAYVPSQYPPPPPTSTSSVKYCMSCGTPIPVQAMFCPRCGGRQ